MLLSYRSLFLITFFGISLHLSACGESEDLQTEKPVLGFADITEVTTSPMNSGYSFNVTISSPDKGCNQYADWWEVIDQNGSLLYRRILSHSHVNEQPFTRSGGLVGVEENQKVWIRAHMNNQGYGGITFFGSVSAGFQSKEMPDGFALGLDQIAPLPGGCAF